MPPCRLRVLLTLGTLFLAVVHAQFTTSRNFGPGVYPMAVRSPYLNCWDTVGQHTSLNMWTNMWTGMNILGWAGLVNVDGQTWEWLGGAAGGSVTANSSTIQKSTVTPTRTIFEIVAGGVLLNVTLLSPIEPNNLVKQSFPFIYLSVQVSSHDGQPHNVQIYSDVSAEWISGDPHNIAVWNTTDTGTSVYHTVTRQDPEQMVETNGMAEDSVLYYAMSKATGFTYQTGQDVVVRNQFRANKTLTGTLDTNFRAINANWPVFALSVDLGQVSTATSPLVWALGVVRNPVIDYLSATARSSYFWSAYSNISDAINDFLNDFSSAVSRADALDSQIMTAAGAISSNYVDLVSLAARQAMASVDFTISEGTNGEWNTSDVKAFMKDVGTTGRVNPVDTLYSAFPVFLYLNASLAGYLLEPLLEYQSSSGYTSNFSAGDLGSQFPRASGNSASTTINATSNTGSMLIMALAHAQFSGDGTLLGQYYHLLKNWADYLIQTSLTGGQSEDGLTKPNMTNLAIKGILGVRSMAAISQAATGKSGDADHYSSQASNLIQQWTSLATASGHISSTYDPGSSRALIYGLYADKLLGLNAINSSVYAEQTSFYSSSPTSAYGVPFDSEESVARSDYTIMTAGTVTDSVTRDAFISMVHSRASNDQLSGAFPTTYDVSSGASTVGLASPGQGAMFALLALNLDRKSFTVNPINDNDDSGPGSNKSTTKAGVIAGATIGPVVGLALLSLAGFLWWRRRKGRSEQADDSNRVPVPFTATTPSFDPVSLYGTSHFQSSTSQSPPSSRKGYPTPSIPTGSVHGNASVNNSSVQGSSAYGSSVASSSRGERNQLMQEMEGLRQEMAELRQQREQDMMPPPMYE